MRILSRFVQFFVGILFIVSGLVKANDPMGLSYKMQEFFELWNSELEAGGFFMKNALMNLFEFMHQHSLSLSVIMIAMEIVAGVALLIGWKKKFILWLLLALIVFFTFLTGYAYLSGKFTNCGCFGDCIPITPLTSFIKDLVLLGMILFLLFSQQYISPFFSARTRAAIMISSTILSFLIQWYVLNYLPFVDCLPFKKGNNIAEQMKPPPGSITDSIAIRFIYEKEGKRYEFAPENLPADFNTYTYVDRIDKLVRKGNAEPPIKGFALKGISGEDSTKAVLDQPKALLIFTQNNLDKDWKKDFQQLVEKANSKAIPVYVASPSLNASAAILSSAETSSVQYFNCDFTVVRTAARTEPTIYFLEKGTIVKKYSHRHSDEAAENLEKGKN